MTASANATSYDIDKNIAAFIDIMDDKQPYETFERKFKSKLEYSMGNNEILKRIQGSLVGLAIGDALGAPVEFQDRSYLVKNPVKNMQDGGTHDLQAGQWTDDSSMALCLAASLISRKSFNEYDQLLRYLRWLRFGYMSSTGSCFDIGNATYHSIKLFETNRLDALNAWMKTNQTKISLDKFDKMWLSDEIPNKFEILREQKGVEGNGALMRLTPIPLFYHNASEETVIEMAAKSALATHGGKQSADACRFYASLIWHAIKGIPKDKLLSTDFAKRFENRGFEVKIMQIINGSYKKGLDGYDHGIRGKGYVVNALEAALWAFYNDENFFLYGARLAVNLGDDTDTTAAIYGQLAGACYGIDKIPEKWKKKLFEYDFITAVANSLYEVGSKVN